MPREEVWRRSARGDWRTAHSEGWKAVGEGEAAHAGRQQARRRVLRKSVCKGMEESLPRFFRFFKKAGLVCFSSVVSGKAEKADAFREIFPALGEECLPPCVFRFLRLIILPLWRGVKRSNEDGEAKAFQFPWLCRKGNVPQEQADTAVKFP